MLSKKYLFIKKCLAHASTVDFLHRKLIVLAQMYIDIDKGFRFSYVSDENGETDFLDALARYYQGDFVYFDVGAHIGTYTDMVVERLQTYEGHLFDVTKDTYEKCLKRHGDNQKLKINNAALSDVLGEIEYRSYPDDPTRNGISGVRGEGDMAFELLTAPCLTGDHYCAENKIERINLLKVDAEGYDLHVLKGFEKMLAQGKVDVIQFEYNVKHSETHSMLGDYYDYLEKMGYLIGPLRQEGVWFRDFDFPDNSFENGPNYVACKPEFAEFLTIFKQGAERSMALGRNSDLNKMLGVVERSFLRLSLDELFLDINRKKYSDAALEQILRRLSLIGLVERTRKKYPRRMQLALKRPDHFREVEQERERLGYYGQNKDAPRYSVCVCNYNMADTLERALTSVLNQLDDKLYEVVVIDDGSNDGSLDELEKLAKAYSNFRYISLPRDPKRHLGQTRNISIRAARGEYVLLHIDADDEWKPYLQDLVKLFHKMEDAAGYDFFMAGQQTGIAKRDFLLSYGGYENVYRCEDRNLMMKLAKEDRLLFLDYRVYRTRLPRPIKKKIFKTIWDDCSHMMYDLRQNEPKTPYIRHALSMLFTRKKASLISRFVRPVLIFPIYLITRFMSPIINPISRDDMRAYHEKHRGTYEEVMSRLGGNSDLSFLSKDSQEIYSHKITNIGFRGE